MPAWSVIDGFVRRLNIPFQPGKSRLSQAESECDAVVNIGGSIFMEKRSWRDHMTDLQRRFVPRGKESFVMGANFGPYRDPDFRLYVASLLARATDTCFRDRYSVAQLHDSGNVRYAPDILFNAQTPPAEINETVVISVIELAHRDSLRDHEEGYTQGVVDLARACGDAGLEVVLMGFCTAEGDGRAVNYLHERIHHSHPDIKIRAYVYDGDPNEALAILASCRAVIASRFHAMILGWTLGKPVYPICYSAKMENVIGDDNFDAPWTTIAPAGSIDAEAVVNTLLNSPPFDVTGQRANADQHFSAFDDYLTEAGRWHR